jgi:hypothetical protein
MRLDDGAADRQTHSQSAVLGRIKRIEDVRQMFSRDPDDDTILARPRTTRIHTYTNV